MAKIDDLKAAVVAAQGAIISSVNDAVNTELQQITDAVVALKAAIADGSITEAQVDDVIASLGNVPSAVAAAVNPSVDALSDAVK